MSALQVKSAKMQSAFPCVLCVLIAVTFACTANATYCRSPLCISKHSVDAVEVSFARCLRVFCMRWGF